MQTNIRFSQEQTYEENDNRPTINVSIYVQMTAYMITI